MKFVTARDFRNQPKAIWQQLKNKTSELVITLNGRPVGVTIPVSERNLEQTLKDLRRLKAERAVHTMQQISFTNENIHMTDAEITAEIQASRSSLPKAA